MNWTADPVMHYAQSNLGYRIDWCENARGLFFNAYAPKNRYRKRGKRIDSGYDLTKLKAKCEEHACTLATA